MFQRYGSLEKGPISFNYSGKNVQCTRLIAQIQGSLLYGLYLQVDPILGKILYITSRQPHGYPGAAHHKLQMPEYWGGRLDRSSLLRGVIAGVCLAGFVFKYVNSLDVRECAPHPP
ncbi:hypothetical protein J6590_065429 [Homalodisca vitripennis]|nr:hypothetical protein J6590_065429 [Homalodisca vitripennis]